MTKKLRAHVPEFAVHITARGVGGRAIFLSDGLRQEFLARLLAIQTEIPFLIHAYCLMTNHIHLLLQAIEVPLGQVMKRLLGRHAQLINMELERMGHLFQRRYDDAVCVTESHYRNAVAYIHNNPVRAKLVGTASDWAWSSHNELVGDANNAFIARSRVIDAFGGNLDGYHEILNRQTPEDAMKITSELLKHRFDPALFAEMNGQAPIEFLDSLAKDCAATTGLSMEDVVGNHRVRRESVARNLFLQRATAAGIPGKLLAAYLGCTAGAISQWRTKFGV